MKTRMLLLVATFLMVGVFSALSQSNPSSTNATDVEMPLSWPDGTAYISELHDNNTSINYYAPLNDYLHGIFRPENWETTVNNVQWTETDGGAGEQKVSYLNSPIPLYRSAYDYLLNWGIGNWPEPDDGYYVSLPNGSTNAWSPPTYPYWNTSSDYGSMNFVSSDGHTTYKFNDRAEVSLITGGDATSQDTELYAITGSAVETKFTDQTLPSGTATAIRPEQIQISNLGSLTATITNGSIISGVLYAALPTHKTIPITPKVTGAKYHHANVSAQGYPLLSQCVATTPTNRARNIIGVCEQVSLSFSSALPTNLVWSVSGGGTLSTNYGKSNIFTAPDVAATNVITMTYPGTSISVKKTFYVQTPIGVKFDKIASQHTQGACEAGFHAGVTILNTNVSFYNVEISEMNCTATGSGCWAFANGIVHPTWTQQGAGWLTPAYNNIINTNTVDYVRVFLAVPNGPGTFVWPIPWNYRKHGATNDGHYFATLTMTATATDTNCTVEKNKMTAQFDNNAPNVSYY